MRRLMIATMAAAALAAPMAAFTSAPADAAPAAVMAPATRVAPAEGTRSIPHLPDLPEEATLVLIGTLLIGFAAAVRRAA